MQNEIFKASSGCHCKRKHQVIPIAVDSQMWWLQAGLQRFAEVVLLHGCLATRGGLLDSLDF